MLGGYFILKHLVRESNILEQDQPLSTSSISPHLDLKPPINLIVTSKNPGSSRSRTIRV